MHVKSFWGWVKKTCLECGGECAVACTYCRCCLHHMFSTMMSATADNKLRLVRQWSTERLHRTTPSLSGQFSPPLLATPSKEKQHTMRALKKLSGGSGARARAHNPVAQALEMQLARKDVQEAVLFYLQVIVRLRDRVRSFKWCDVTRTKLRRTAPRRLCRANGRSRVPRAIVLRKSVKQMWR